MSEITPIECCFFTQCVSGLAITLSSATLLTGLVVTAVAVKRIRGNFVLGSGPLPMATKRLLTGGLKIAFVGLAGTLAGCTVSYCGTVGTITIVVRTPE